MSKENGYGTLGYCKNTGYSKSGAGAYQIHAVENSVPLPCHPSSNKLIINAEIDKVPSPLSPQLVYHILLKAC